MSNYGYIRVSGHGQIDGDGEHRQKLAIESFCEQHSIPVVTLFEKAVSGTVDGLARPVLSEIFEFNDTEAIVVERLDRLARDLMVQEFILKECRQRGIKVYAADQGALFDLASNEVDPTRKLIRQLLGALAEWEKSALVLKLRKSRDAVRAKTGRCEGPLPYGATADELSVRTLIFSLHNEHTMGARALATFLNANGYTTRHGHKWTRDAVRKILNRKTQTQ